MPTTRPALAALVLALAAPLLVAAPATTVPPVARRDGPPLVERVVDDRVGDVRAGPRTSPAARRAIDLVGATYRLDRVGERLRVTVRFRDLRDVRGSRPALVVRGLRARATTDYPAGSFTAVVPLVPDPDVPFTVSALEVDGARYDRTARCDGDTLQVDRAADVAVVEIPFTCLANPYDTLADPVLERVALEVAAVAQGPRGGGARDVLRASAQVPLSPSDESVSPVQDSRTPLSTVPSDRTLAEVTDPAGDAVVRRLTTAQAASVDVVAATHVVDSPGMGSWRALVDLAGPPVAGRWRMTFAVHPTALPADALGAQVPLARVVLTVPGGDLARAAMRTVLRPDQDREALAMSRPCPASPPALVPGTVPGAAVQLVVDVPVACLWPTVSRQRAPATAEGHLSTSVALRTGRGPRAGTGADATDGAAERTGFGPRA